MRCLSQIFPCTYYKQVLKNSAEMRPSMNIEQLKASGIDYDEGLDRFSGNSHLYEKYLKKLLDITLYEEMKQAIEHGDIEVAFDCAHKLKSLIGNLSINHFYNEIKNLTDQLRAKTVDKQEIRKNLAALDKEYTKILEAIKCAK